MDILITTVVIVAWLTVLRLIDRRAQRRHDEYMRQREQNIRDFLASRAGLYHQEGERCRGIGARTPASCAAWPAARSSAESSAGCSSTALPRLRPSPSPYWRGCCRTSPPPWSTPRSAPS